MMATSSVLFVSLISTFTLKRLFHNDNSSRTYFLRTIEVLWLSEEKKIVEGKDDKKLHKGSKLKRSAVMTGIVGISFGFGFLMAVDLGTGPNKEWEKHHGKGNRVSDTVSFKELASPNYLNDKKFAMQVDDDRPKTGIMFVDRDGEAEYRKLGTSINSLVTSAKDRVFTLDKQKAYIFGKDAKSARVDYGIEDPYVIASGYLETAGRFAAVLYDDSGKEKNNKYAVLLETSKGFKAFNFDGKIMSGGFDGSTIRVVTTDDTGTKYTYREYTVADDSIKEISKTDIGSFPGVDNGLFPYTTRALSPIVTVGDSSFVMVSQRVDNHQGRVSLYELTKDGKKAYEMKLYYVEDVSNAEDFLPNDGNLNLEERNGSLFYTDGYGELHRFDLKTKEWFEVMKVTKPMDAMSKKTKYPKVYAPFNHQDGLLYAKDELMHFRFNTNTDTYDLATYKIKTGELVSEKLLKDLSKDIKKNYKVDIVDTEFRYIRDVTLIKH